LAAGIECNSINFDARCSSPDQIALLKLIFIPAQRASNHLIIVSAAWFYSGFLVNDRRCTH
jgi:hypothetical protein